MTAAAAAASLTLRRSASPSLLTKLFSKLRPSHFAPAASRSLNSNPQMHRFDDDHSVSEDERPFLNRVRRGPLSFSSWDLKEDMVGLYLRMDMPGLGKENVKVSVEQNTLVINGEGDKEADDDDVPRRYSNRIDLPENILKLDGIKAEMKNGVLKVMVPKLKAEERTDLRHVQIQ